MQTRSSFSRNASRLVLCLSAFGSAYAQLLAPPPLKPLPRATETQPGLNQALPKAPAAKANAAASTFEPAWPLHFELLAGERESSGFAVTQPGPVRVELQATGAPLVLSLRRPDGRVIERQGSGQVVIDDVASAADIAKGALWGVGLRAAQEAPNAGAAAVTARALPRPVAGGTLSVRHPAADAALVSAALNQAQAKAAVPMQKPVAPAIDAQAQAKAAQATHDKQVAAGHAAMLGKLQSSLPPAAFAQINQRIGLRLQGQSLQQANAAVPVQLVKAKAMSAPVMLAAPGAQPPQMAKGMMPLPKGGTGSTQAAATGGAAPVGSAGAAAAAAPSAPVLAAAPALAALSTGEGDPGTPVTLSGSDFGEAPGEVHVIVGNGRDVVAPITYWSATQIVTEVPYADGIPVYDGHVYVKRSDGAKSALRPFRFLPLYDVVEIGMPEGSTERSLAPSVANVDGYVYGDVAHTAAIFWGFKGDDRFYMNAQTRNGWIVTGARLYGLWLDRVGYGDAYLVNASPGTTSPFVQVHWWLDAAFALGGSNSLKYQIRVAVQRPKNLPCQANPCPVL